MKPAAGAAGVATRIVAERILGESVDNSQDKTFFTDRGDRFEPEALMAYEMLRDVEVTACGFVESEDGGAGCSPDGLVMDYDEIRGGVELKNRGPQNHLGVVLGTHTKNTNEAKAQVQFSMWVTGAQWWDVVHYHPTLKSHVSRMHRDPAFMDALDKAYANLVEMIDRLTLVYESIEGRWAEDDNLMALLAASLRMAEAADGALSDDERLALEDDLSAARKVSAADAQDIAAIMDDLANGRWAEVRTMWAHVKRAMSGLQVVE